MCHQVAQQIVEVFGTNDFAKIAGHQRQVRGNRSLDLVFGNGNLFAGGIGNGQGVAFFAAQDAGDDLAGGQHVGVVAEGGIHIAAGIEKIFAKARDAADADPTDTMAGEAALLEDFLPAPESRILAERMVFLTQLLYEPGNAFHGQLRPRGTIT